MINVEYVDHCGDDLSVVNAARVSFHKESEWEYCDLDGQACTDKCEEEAIECPKLPERDRRLISYLARHGHFTPFTHNAITLRVKAPIFVRSQLYKHKVGMTENEVSRRYVKEDPEFFVPEEWRAAPENAKQGSGEILTVQRPYFKMQSFLHEAALDIYKQMIHEGVAPEQARMILPQDLMTEWWWTGSLAAFARMYNLRSDPHAQYEVRLVAQQVDEIIHPLFPNSWEELTV